MACLTAPENQPVDYDARVAAGITILNSNICPAGWLDRINVATLDLGSYRHDVFAQVWGHRFGYLDLGLTEDQAYACGLEPHEDEPAVHELLTDAWVRAITAMRAERQHADRKVA